MDQHRFAHLAQRIFNVPLAITPQKAEIIVAALAQRLGIVPSWCAWTALSWPFDGDYEADESEEKAKPARLCDGRPGGRHSGAGHPGAEAGQPDAL
jgi:hypothetical protein